MPQAAPDAAPDRRRAALIATAVTVPLVVILAFALSSHRATHPGTSAVTVSAPTSDAAAEAPCEKVVEKLPVRLGDRAPRAVHGAKPAVDTTYVVAWGDPPVVLSCGVGRPAALTPTSELFVTGQGQSNVLVLRTSTKSANVFTVVDRAVYVAVQVPTSQTKSSPLAQLAALIARALPTAVCQAQSDTGDVPDEKLCTHRR